MTKSCGGAAGQLCADFVEKDLGGLRKPTAAGLIVSLSSCGGCRRRDELGELGELAEVLGCGGEEELVTSAAGAA